MKRTEDDRDPELTQTHRYIEHVSFDGFTVVTPRENEVPHWREVLRQRVAPELRELALVGVSAVHAAVHDYAADNGIPFFEISSLPLFLSPDDISINPGIGGEDFHSFEMGNPLTTPLSQQDQLFLFGKTLIELARSATRFQTTAQVKDSRWGTDTDRLVVADIAHGQEFKLKGNDQSTVKMRYTIPAGARNGFNSPAIFQFASEGHLGNVYGNVDQYGYSSQNRRAGASVSSGFSDHGFSRNDHLHLGNLSGFASVMHRASQKPSLRV